MKASRRTPEFDIRLAEPTRTVVTGFAEYGLAGLTAADYLRKELELEETGHIAVDDLPAITPFENGTPRYHTRLFSKPDFDITVLVGELFVPPFAAKPFTDSVLEYSRERAVEEFVTLTGVPLAHGPDDHRAFYVASEDYQEAHLRDDEDIRAMTGGFLDGVNGALMQSAIDSPLKTCTLLTPVHAQAPDVEASLRLLEALDGIYDLDLDTGPLEEFAEAVSTQYEELAARLEAREEYGPEDRMYM